jgi:hypothetical protein
LPLVPQPPNTVDLTRLKSVEELLKEYREMWIW